ncbi:MAG: hypothetical protein Q9N67_08715 [Ghiorsea sp.]|nr:hypothetical protein [Ghiorsea sp.]
MMIRWDASSFLRSQVDAAAQQAGYTLNYDHVAISGMGIVFEPLSIQQGQQASIKLDKLQLSLALSQLFSGTLALDIDAIWQGNPIHTNVAQNQGVLLLSNIDAQVDMSHLNALQIPAQLSGIIQLKGDISLLDNTGLPQSGKLHLTWNQAKAGLSSPEFTLGDYTLELASQTDAAQPWQWVIAGGSGVSLHGSGTLFPNHPDPKYWSTSGLVEAKIDNSNPSLSMMMQSMMGSTQAKLQISGTLGLPRTEIVR